MKTLLTHIKSKKGNNRIVRYPNLQTVLMVEETLKKKRDMPITISALKKQLPRQVMHGTVHIILEYLWRSGKIIYGPRGIQWIYAEPTHIQEMMMGSIEV